MMWFKNNLQKPSWQYVMLNLLVAEGITLSYQFLLLQSLRSAFITML